MAVWLIAAIERLSQRARRVVVAATAVLLLAGAITSLTLQAGRGPGGWPAGSDRTCTGSPTRRAADAATSAPAGLRLRSAPRQSCRQAVPALVPEVRLRQGPRDFGGGGHAGPAQPAGAGSCPGHAGRARPPSAGRVTASARYEPRVRSRDGESRGRRDRAVSAAVYAPGRGRPVAGGRCAGGVSRDGGRDPPARHPGAHRGGGRVPAAARRGGGAADGRDRRDLHRQRRR